MFATSPWEIDSSIESVHENIDSHVVGDNRCTIDCCSGIVVVVGCCHVVDGNTGVVDCSRDVVDHCCFVDCTRNIVDNGGIVDRCRNIVVDRCCVVVATRPVAIDSKVDC